MTSFDWVKSSWSQKWVKSGSGLTTPVLTVSCEVQVEIRETATGVQVRRRRMACGVSMTHRVLESPAAAAALVAAADDDDDGDDDDDDNDDGDAGNWRLTLGLAAVGVRPSQVQLRVVQGREEAGEGAGEGRRGRQGQIRQGASSRHGRRYRGACGIDYLPADRGAVVFRGDMLVVLWVNWFWRGCWGLTYVRGAGTFTLGMRVSLCVCASCSSLSFSLSVSVLCLCLFSPSASASAIASVCVDDGRDRFRSRRDPSLGFGSVSNPPKHASRFRRQGLAPSAVSCLRGVRARNWVAGSDMVVCTQAMRCNMAEETVIKETSEKIMM
eukprot:1266990-Rhodomonas_salina.5